MQELNIQDNNVGSASEPRNQVVSNSGHCPTAHSRQSNDRLEHVTLRPGRQYENGQQAVVRAEESAVSSVARPKTPPHTAQQALAMIKDFGDSLASAAKTPRSPVKSPCSKKVPFLTKESNTRNFTAWDVDERLSELDNQFKVMKEVMNVSLTDRKAMDEAINLAKTRGTFTSTPLC